MTTDTSPGVAPENDDDEPGRDWPVWARPYLEALRRRPSQARAAEAVGVTARTVQRLAVRDETFAVAQHAAREAALDLLEEIIFARATSGLPVKKTVRRTLPNGTVETTETEEQHVSDILAMFYLKRWRPEYRESFRVEQSGTVNVKVDAEALDRDISRILEDLGAGG